MKPVRNLAFLLAALMLSAAPSDPWQGAPELIVHTRPLELSGELEGDEAGYFWLASSDTSGVDLSLETDNSSLCFNLFAPGELPGTGTATFIGSRDGTRFSGPLPAGGDCLIQVYLMRNAARRGESATYRLSISPR